jgi:uncharacterized SAM-binding protein YcdF (DUF218 family)
LLRRLAARALMSAAVIFLAVTFTPLTAWWTGYFARPWHGAAGGTLIVLTGSEVVPGIMGYSSYWRSVAAVRAWRTGQFGAVVLSGKGSTTAVMESFLLAHGIPAEKIQREDKSQTTRESGLHCRQLLGGRGPLVLLTSDYHTKRAYQVFVRAGLSVKTLPAPDAMKRIGQYSQRWLVAEELTVETIKSVYYWWNDWT